MITAPDPAQTYKPTKPTPTTSDDHTWLTFHRGDPNGDWTWEGRPATENTTGAVPVTILDVA